MNPSHTKSSPIPFSWKGLSMDTQAHARARPPGNEFPGSIDASRLKPTADNRLESPSGAFSATEPGNSFPGVRLARAPQYFLRDNRYFLPRERARGGVRVLLRVHCESPSVHRRHAAPGVLS